MLIHDASRPDSYRSGPQRDPGDLLNGGTGFLIGSMNPMFDLEKESQSEAVCEMLPITADRSFPPLGQSS
jgi:hypothetical protein